MYHVLATNTIHIYNHM